jgi:hypothetical protein
MDAGSLQTQKPARTSAADFFRASSDRLQQPRRSLPDQRLRNKFVTCATRTIPFIQGSAKIPQDMGFRGHGARIAIRGFAAIGAVSTAIWAVTLPNPIWELLSAGLACFLLAALAEVYILAKQLAQIHNLGEFLTALTEISQEGRDLLESNSVAHELHDAWKISGEARIATYDAHYAHEFAQPLESRHPENARGTIGMRLKVLEDIVRDARASNKLIK